MPMALEWWWLNKVSRIHQKNTDEHRGVDGKVKEEERERDRNRKKGDNNHAIFSTQCAVHGFNLLSVEHIEFMCLFKL